MKKKNKYIMMFIGGLLGLLYIIKNKVVAVEPIPPDEPPIDNDEPISYVAFGHDCKKVKLLYTDLPTNLSNYIDRVSPIQLLEDIDMRKYSSVFPVDMPIAGATWKSGKIIYYPTALIYESLENCMNRNISGIPAQTVACADTGLHNGYCKSPYNSSQYSNLTLSNINNMICPNITPYIFYMNTPRKLRCIDDPYYPLLNFNPYPTSPGLNIKWFDIGNTVNIIYTSKPYIGLMPIKFNY